MPERDAVHLASAGTRRAGHLAARLQRGQATLGVARSDAGLNHAAAVLACVKTAARRLRRWPAASLDTGGEFRRRRGATSIRAMLFACNDDSRPSQLRVFSIFLTSAPGKHGR